MKGWILWSMRWIASSCKQIFKISDCKKPRWLENRVGTYSMKTSRSSEQISQPLWKTWRNLRKMCKQTLKIMQIHMGTLASESVLWSSRSTSFLRKWTSDLHKNGLLFKAIFFQSYTSAYKKHLLSVFMKRFSSAFLSRLNLLLSVCISIAVTVSYYDQAIGQGWMIPSRRTKNLGQQCWYGNCQSTLQLICRI